MVVLLVFAKCVGDVGHVDGVLWFVLHKLQDQSLLHVLLGDVIVVVVGIGVCGGGVGAMGYAYDIGGASRSDGIGQLVRSVVHGVASVCWV